MDEKTLQTFKDYISLKLHFSDESFMFNQDSKMSKIDMTTLMKRKDIKFFVKLTENNRTRKERMELLISLFLKNQNAWIGEIFEDELKDFHSARLAKTKALKHTFEKDTKNILEYMTENKKTIKELLLTNNDVPDIIKNRSKIVGGISDETLALLDKAFKFCRQKTDNPLWRQRSFSIAKYKHFLEIDKDFYISVLEKLAATNAEF